MARARRPVVGLLIVLFIALAMSLAVAVRVAGPTFADLTQLLTVPAAPAGSAVTQRLSPGGSISIDPTLAAYKVTDGQPAGPSHHGSPRSFRPS